MDNFTDPGAGPADLALTDLKVVWSLSELGPVIGEEVFAAGDNGLYTGLVVNVPVVSGSGTLFYYVYAANACEEDVTAPGAQVLITVP